MIQNLNLGPPIAGLPSLKPQERDEKNAGSESFGKSLEQKMGSKEKLNPKEADLQRAPNKEPKAEAKSEIRKESKPNAAKKKDSEVSEKEAKPEKGKEKTASREEAIQKFMDSFESEFQVPPTRLVEVIANLDEETQMKSPEETADAVIAQLGLAPEEQEKAQAMYAALLVTLSQTTQPAAKSTMMAEAGQAFGQEFRQRVQTASDQRSMMNMGVDRLNQKFWAKEPLMPTSPSQGLSRLMGEETMPDIASDELAQATNPTPASAPVTNQLELPPHLRGQLEQNASPAMMAALAAKMAQAKAAAAQEGGSEEGENVESEVVPETGTASTANAANMVEMPMESMPADSSGNAFAQNENAAGDNAFAKNLEGQKEKNQAGEKLLQKSDFKQALKSLSDLNPHAMPLKAEQLQVQGAAAGAGAAMAAPTPSSAENETNVRQLMNQAQYLIKKGGGEVKVQMTPEGMGPVHLKLMVQDGKVNVHMSASTDEAKQAIESSLAELKTSLAAHKLSVDHVKVDVVNNTSTDTATNNQQQMNQNAQRDSTRQFWNQFNDNFGSRSQRDSYQEMGNLKGYSKAQRDPLKPIEASEKRTVAGKGQGLNLVA